MSEETSNPVELQNWLSAVEAYVKKTNVTCLDLSRGRIPSAAEKVVGSILTFLPESQVTELSLKGISLDKECFELLKQTKVRKLKCSISSCDEFLKLAEVVNDSQILDLTADYDGWDGPGVFEGKELVSKLLQSRLIKLHCPLFFRIDKVGALSFVEALPNSSLTSLDISDLPGTVNCSFRSWFPEFLPALFSKLPHSQIKELRLSGHTVDSDSIKVLSQNLATSKIEHLELSAMEMDSADFDVLAHGLVNSKVVILNLGCNCMYDLNRFGHCLKNTKIRLLNLSHNSNFDQVQMIGLLYFLVGSGIETLDVSYCYIGDELGADFMKSLKDTNLTKLNLTRNNLGVRSISALAGILRDTKLEDVDFALNDLSAEAFDILNGCCNESNLKHIKFSLLKADATTSCLTFLEGTKSSSIHSVEIMYSNFSLCQAHHFAQALMNSTLTHLNLEGSNLSGVFTDLALNLKYTSITHLNLCDCNIKNKGVQLLGEQLKETKIMELDLSQNQITSEGASVLARCCPQTSLTHLNLRVNHIENDGLKVFAEHLTGSLITTLNVERNPGKHTLLVDKILWENRLRSYNLVAQFKQFYSETCNGTFQFRLSICDKNIDEFLEECLQFYKRAIEQPAVVSILLQEESLSLSREELVSLLFDKFPCQLVEFISYWVEADVTQHVKFLMQAEELGLEQIVEHLLLLRPLFQIDEKEEIMHPYVYTLLLKYKQLICNLDVEPQGIKKIINYFTMHCDLEGAQDVVNLLSKLDKRNETIAAPSLSSE